MAAFVILVEQAYWITDLAVSFHVLCKPSGRQQLKSLVMTASNQPVQHSIPRRFRNKTRKMLSNGFQWMVRSFVGQQPLASILNTIRFGSRSNGDAVKLWRMMTKHWFCHSDREPGRGYRSKPVVGKWPLGKFPLEETTAVSRVFPWSAKTWLNTVFYVTSGSIRWCLRR